MNDIPLFSVLIANYNNGRFLQEAIDSVLAQTYTNWEVVIVDDASTDNSTEIYKRYQQDSRFHIYYNERNQGCGYTKRRCAELAQGELCGFLDADDTLLPESLYIMTQTHQENQNISSVFSRFYYCNEKMEPIEKLRLLEIPEGETYFTTMDYSPEHFVSFKREMYARTSGISSDLPKAVDQDLYFKLEEIAPILVINQFTYKYRVHSNSISNGDSAYIAKYWNTIVRHKTCERRGLDPTKYAAKIFVDFIAEEKYYITQYNKIKQSKAYNVGRVLLWPIHLVKRMKCFQNDENKQDQR